MDYLNTIAIVLVLIAIAIGLWAMNVQRARLDAARAELDRWHIYWQESRRWLAEFPDVADALEHLYANATGAGGTDIVRTREAMRKRRDGAAPPVPTGLSAKADVMSADEFDMRCRQNSAECCDCEPVPQLRWDGLGGIGGA
jgi:hypothetical protein